MGIDTNPRLGNNSKSTFSDCLSSSLGLNFQLVSSSLDGEIVDCIYKFIYKYPVGFSARANDVFGNASIVRIVSVYI